MQKDFSPNYNQQPDQPLTNNGLDIKLENQEFKNLIKSTEKRLKRQYGEDFVKGEINDQGGRMGEGAREILSNFFELPNFVEQINGLIPNKHNALKLLRDNQDYIITYLKDYYEKTGDLQQPEIVKNPFELAKSVGFELTGPFLAPEELQPFEKDFRPGERLCTFNNISNRLNAYHILWLRKENADQVLPADELTQDNLSPEWQVYLRMINRYDEATDTYHLSDLKPSREDPYGTSSMSVQISKTGQHVSLKNRYNHTVSNPDTTYDNNLDNIAYGLKPALYHLAKREDLLTTEKTPLDGGYILDNNGGIHECYQEINNIYLGHYEFLENGQVTTVDKLNYLQLSPNLYLKIIGPDQGGILVPTGDQLASQYQTTADGYTLALKNHTGITQIYRFTRHPENQPPELSLEIPARQKIDDITHNQLLTKLTLGEDSEVDYIYKNQNLKEVILHRGSKARSIEDSPNLQAIALAGANEVDYVFNNPELKILIVKDNSQIRSIDNNQRLTTISIGEDTAISQIENNPSLSNVVLNDGSKIESITHNPQLTEVLVQTLNGPQIVPIDPDTNLGAFSPKNKRGDNHA